jgi:hypothetical protein
MKLENIVRNGRPAPFGVGANFQVDWRLSDQAPERRTSPPSRPQANVRPPPPPPQVSVRPAPPPLRPAPPPIERRSRVPIFPIGNRPAPPPSAAMRAHETAVARAWRPAWGVRPVGFGATRWLPEWGNRPAWFGARRWRGEWGAQPAWWDSHVIVVQTAPPDDQDGPQPPTTADASSPATPGGTPPALPDPATASPTTASPKDIATKKSGLSTVAKVGIGLAAVAVVGSAVAAILHGNK